MFRNSRTLIRSLACLALATVFAVSLTAAANSDEAAKWDKVIAQKSRDPYSIADQVVDHRFAFPLTEEPGKGKGERKRRR